MIGASQEELQLFNMIANTNLGEESVLSFYGRLLEELRVDRRAAPTKDEFTDVFEFASLIARYANLLSQRINACNREIFRLEEMIRKYDPDSVLPKLTQDSEILVDGRTVTFDQMLAMITEMAQKPPDQP